MRQQLFYITVQVSSAYRSPGPDRVGAGGVWTWGGDACVAPLPITY